MSSTYVHSIDPFALQISGDLGIRWYGLAYLAGFLLGYWIVIKLIAKGNTIMTKEKLPDFTTLVAVGTLAGGRLGYCLFYKPELFFEFDPMWGVLKVWEGGMASHGGIFGIIIVCFLYGKYQKMSKLHVLDLTCFGGALGIFFGRIANFINGELYGRAAKESFSLAVKFPQEVYLWIHKITEKAPDADLARAKLAGLGKVVEKMNLANFDTGRPMKLTAEMWDSWVQTFYGFQSQIHNVLDQMILATQDGNAEVLAGMGSVLTARHPSQLYQALLEGLMVFIVLCVMWLKPRKPGMIASMFGIIYAIARIIGEEFRMPDAHLGYQALGLTRGQWLSIGFLVFAFGFLYYSSKRNERPIGGWFPNK